jgi:integrase
VRGKTEAECRDALARTRITLADFNVVPNGTITVASVAERWLASHGPQVSTGTLGGYKRRVRLYVVPTLGSKRLRELTVADVDKWQRELERKGLSLSTRKGARTCLVQMIKWAMRHDYVLRNVAQLSPGPRGTSKTVNSLTRDEARAVLKAVSGWRQEAAVVIMMTAGLRVGEALGLRWSDVELDATPSRLSVVGQLVREPRLHYQPDTKTHEPRVVDLPAIAVDALKAHRERQNKELADLGTGDAKPSDYVFVSAAHTMLDPRNFARELKDRTESTGLHVHPHKLRHTAVSLLCDQGVPIETVSKIVGHRSSRTTSDLYRSMLADGRASAAAAMDAALA